MAGPRLSWSGYAINASIYGRQVLMVHWESQMERREVGACVLWTASLSEWAGGRCWLPVNGLKLFVFNNIAKYITVLGSPVGSCSKVAVGNRLMLQIDGSYSDKNAKLQWQQTNKEKPSTALILAISVYGGPKPGTRINVRKSLMCMHRVYT